MASVIKVNEIQNTSGTTALSIDGSGIVTPKVPTFRATLSSNQTLTDATWSLMEFDNADWNVGSFYNTSTYRFTPTVAGYYQFNLIYYVANSNTIQLERYIGSIAKNGNYGGGRVWDLDFYDATLNSYQTMNGSRMYYLNGTTDFVHAYAWIDLSSGSSPVLNTSYTCFEGRLVSTA